MSENLKRLGKRALLQEFEQQAVHYYRLTDELDEPSDESVDSEGEYLVRLRKEVLRRMTPTKK